MGICLYVYPLFWLDVMTNELFKSSFALNIKMRLCTREYTSPEGNGINKNFAS